MTGQPLATSGELITVVICEQRFAIDIQLVREIRG